jgi:uncharacterized membrane protein
MDFDQFKCQVFVPGTFSCTIFGAVIGLVFAILCLTLGFGKAVLIGVCCLIGAFLGGVRDKSAFVKRTVLFFHKDRDQY